MNVVVNGLMTNYQTFGRGKAIVCLPGWADNTTSFAKLVDQLKDRYQLIVLDLPGFGGTESPPNAWSLEDYAGFVCDWLKKININNLEAIVGHSYGGAVAITALAEDHQLANKLVLLAAAGVRGKRGLRKRLLKTTAKVGKLPLYLMPASKRRKLRRNFYNAIGSNLTLLPHMEQTFKRIIGEDVRPAASQLKLPTLLIYGRRDKDTPPADGRKLQMVIENSQLSILDAGHFLHQDEPQAVAKLIADLLEAKS